MKRRTWMLVVGAVAIGAGRHVAAQPKARARPARIALLDDAAPPVRAELWDAFRRRLGAIGYSAGQDVVIEARWAAGDLQRLPALANELVELGPDVIVVVTTTVALVAKKATATIPIVALGPADPVKSGLVASLSRPGGNLTGISPNQAEIAGKWVEIIRQIVPQGKRVAYLTDPANPGEMLVFGEVRQRAQSHGLEARALDGVRASGVDEAFSTMRREAMDALIVATTTSLLPHRERIVESATNLRIPAIYARQEYLEAGGLLTYGTNLQALFSRAADYVHRILQGSAPGELPFEMASTFTMALNLRAARTLGLRIPQAILARADRVID